MSGKIGRNDPCPCGSGRKYKKCCQARQQDEGRQVSARRSAQERRNEVFMHVLEWLGRRHQEALRAALDEFRVAAPEEGRVLSASDEDYLAMQSVEWALAQGTTEIDGRRVRLRDLVLEGGPLLEADQKLWFERATEEPLRLWRVARVEPGVGLELENLLDGSAEAVWVRERSVSRSAKRSEVIAARLGFWQDAWEIATVYQIPEAESLRLLDFLEANSEDDPGDPDAARVTGLLIRDYWVDLFTRARTLPTLVDPSGEAIELTTDHWQVLDEEELARRLGAQPDIVGSREDGWSRLKNPQEELSSTLLALNPGRQEDRLEAFARTRSMADAGRLWLEEIAGSSLRFLTREIVDPRSPRALGDKRPKPEGPKAGTRKAADPSGTIPPEFMTQMMAEVYRKQYQGIADQKIPAVGDKSLRQTLRIAGGERRVRLWLEGVERNELRLAAQQDREPVELSYLWQEIGLEPPA